MAATVLVQTRIDPGVKERAAEVLDGLGMTVSDAVRILLTRTAKEGALPFTLLPSSGEYDAWFRAKVLEAMADERPGIANERVKERFARRRAEAGDALA